MFVVFAFLCPLNAQDTVDAQDTVEEVDASIRDQLSVCATAESFSSSEAKRILAISEQELFAEASYEELREIFSDRFERICKSEIDAAWLPAFQAWISKHHSQKKQELFTALNPELDKVESALRVVNRTVKSHPKRSTSFWNLVIALAVTWDEPRNVYYYDAHADRSGSKMPKQLANGSDNFSFLLANEKELGANWKMLPWEFLVFAVDHKTPVVEREWAVENFVNDRKTIGKCYSDVPYDFKMLETKRRQTKLMGKQYTLPNLLRLGGVCAQQADFASRVGKSVGVPSSFVWGESAYGEMHSWVMWVQLNRVTENQISFSLKSHGRIKSDKYYVGILKEPRFGKRITDRHLDLELDNVAASPRNNRHANRLVDCYELFAKQRSFTPEQRLSYLMKIVEFCPCNRRAWIQISTLMDSSDFEGSSAIDVNQIVDKFMGVFSKKPDFTWMIFEAMIGSEHDLNERIEMYRRLIKLYKRSRRPDLECNAKISISSLQVEAGNSEDAIEDLAIAIMKQAGDARSMPMLLDRLESICGDNEELTTKLVAFYKKFLPKVPPNRGRRPSPHCIKMYERGIETFKEAGDNQAASHYLAKLRQLKSK